jgi:hypothetical protein
VHNGELLQRWGLHDHELEQSKGRHPADEKTYLLWELSKTATEVRAVALVMRLQVGSWLLLRADLLPIALIPCLHKVRRPFGIDILSDYQTMTDLAKQLSQFYGLDWAEKMSTVL